MQRRKTYLIFMVPYLRSAVNLSMFSLALNSEHGNTNQDLHTGLTFQVIFNGPWTHYHFHTVHNVVIVLSTFYKVISWGHCMVQDHPHSTFIPIIGFGFHRVINIFLLSLPVALIPDLCSILQQSHQILTKTIPHFWSHRQYRYSMNNIHCPIFISYL